MERILLPVREIDGAPRVDCPRQHRPVLFSECQSCEHGSVVRLKHEALPYMVCECIPGAVGSAMSRVVAVRADRTVEELIRLFLDEGIGVAPVVDADGKTVGVVSKSDLCFGEVGWGQLRDAALSAWPRGSSRYDAGQCEGDLYVDDILRKRTVGDFMTGAVQWVSPETELCEAAKRMEERRLHHLPVLDESGRPVGMLHMQDLVRQVAAKR